jgi:hypothetical protein
MFKSSALGQPHQYDDTVLNPELLLNFINGMPNNTMQIACREIDYQSNTGPWQVEIHHTYQVVTLLVDYNKFKGIT